MLYFPIFFKFRDETFQIQAKKNKQTNKQKTDHEKLSYTFFF